MQAPEHNKISVVRVFFASPSDINKERKSFPKILDSMNTIRADRDGFHFKPQTFKNALPGFGRAQGQINKVLNGCEILVMVFGKKWGSPTGLFDCGTEEEFNVAFENFQKNAETELFAYFRSLPEKVMINPDSDTRKILAFKKQIESKCFYKEYSSLEEWDRMFREDLAHWLDTKKYGDPFGRNAHTTPDSIIADLRNKTIELENKIQLAQTKLKKEALNYATQAIKFAQERKPATAEEYFLKSVEISEEPEAVEAFAFFLFSIGSFKRSINKYKRLIKLAIDTKNDPFLAVACGNLGIVYRTIGKLNMSEKMYMKAFNIFKALNDKEGNANAYNNLGVLYEMKGNPAKCNAMHNEALAINIQLKRPFAIASTYGNLGNLYLEQHDLDNAEQMFKMSLEIAVEMNWEEGIANAFNGLGIIYSIKGEHNSAFLKDAEEKFTNAGEIFEKIGKRIGKVSAYANLGIIYMTQGDFTKAENQFQKQLEAKIDLGDKPGMATSYNNLGNVYSRQDLLAKAGEMYQKSLELNQDIGIKSGIASNYFNLGLVYKKLGQIKDAKKFFFDAKKAYNKLGNKEFEAKAQSNLDSLSST